MQISSSNANTQNLELYFQISFPRLWSEIAKIREFVKEKLTNKIDDDLIDSICMAASELAENVCKYSCWGSGIFEIILHEKELIFSVKNLANINHYKICERIVNLVNEGDPLKMYQGFMIRSIQNEDDSQLGLARIRYETRGKLSLIQSDDLSEISDDDTELIPDEIKADFEQKKVTIVNVTTYIAL